MLASMLTAGGRTRQGSFFAVSCLSSWLSATCLNLWLLSSPQSGPDVHHLRDMPEGVGFDVKGVKQESHRAPASITPTTQPAVRNRLSERGITSVVDGTASGLAEDALASRRKQLRGLKRQAELSSTPSSHNRAAKIDIGFTARAGPAAQHPRTTKEAGTGFIANAVAQPEALGPKEVMDAPDWLKYAASPPRPLAGRPMIGIVIDDVGMNQRKTEALLQLDGPLTLAFLPYASDLRRQTAKARAAGHELLLHMPMEPIGREWPGPNALLSSLSPPEFMRRLRAALESFSGFVGLNNHMGSRLTTQDRPMRLVMAELHQRGLLFLDSLTEARSVGAREAQRHRVPFARRDVFLDNQIDLKAVVRQLAWTERLARRRGYAVAIGHPHRVTIEALRSWLPGAKRRGLELVPISTIAGLRTCAEPLLVASCMAKDEFADRHHAPGAIGDGDQLGEPGLGVRTATAAYPP